MTITQFKYVLALDKFKNFTKAAKACDIAQPTLSMQINKLEKELGVSIFNRDSKPLETTKIGKKLIDQIEIVITETSKIKQTKDFHINKYVKNIKIGISRDFESIVNYLPLKKLNSEKIISIVEGRKDKLLNKLIREDLDFIISSKPKYSNDFISVPFYYEPLMVLIPENYKKNYKDEITLKDIRSSDLIMPYKSTNFTKIISNFFVEKDFKKNIKTNNLNTIIKLSNSGMGLTIVPYLKSEELSNSIKKNVYHFKSPHPSRELCFVYKKNSLKKNIILETLDMIKSEMKKVYSFSDVKILK